MSVQLYLNELDVFVPIDELDISWTICHSSSFGMFGACFVSRRVDLDGTVRYKTNGGYVCLLVHQLELERAKLKAAEEYIAKLECMPCDQTWKECKEAVEEEIKVINFNS